MIEITGNLWDYHDKGIPICITTNGSVKKDGTAVMGAGCALEAAKRYPEFPKWLGFVIRGSGISSVILSPYHIFVFPVKHDWQDNADLSLIILSCHQLIWLLDELRIGEVILPRPGCGYGGLQWETQVKPAIKDILDDRVKVITFK